MAIRRECVISAVPEIQFVYPDSHLGYVSRPAPTRVGVITGFVGDW